MKSNGEKRDRAEDVFYLSVATVSIGLLVYIWLQPWAYLPTVGRLGMAVFPTAFMAILLIASIIGVIFRKSQKERLKRPTAEERFRFWPVCLLGVATVGSAYGLTHIDPTITSGVFVLLLLLGGGIRDWRLLAGLPIGTGLLIYILFIRVISTYFPNVWLR